MPNKTEKQSVFRKEYKTQEKNVMEFTNQFIIYIQLSIYIDTYLSICVQFSIFRYLFIYMCMRLSSCLSIYLFICLSKLSICLLILLSICLQLSINEEISYQCANTKSCPVPGWSRDPMLSSDWLTRDKTVSHWSCRQVKAYL